MDERGLLRVGHKGAALIAPGNTTASFDAALSAGVDMIEFDVLPSDDGGRLVLAHDPQEASHRGVLTLTEGLDHLASDPFAAVDLDVDLKLPGYELEVVERLRERGLVARTLISTHFPESLRLLRSIEPGLRLGLSVPKVRRDPFRSPWLVPLGAVAVRYGQRVMPSRAARAIRSRLCDALMCHWRLVTPALVSAVTGAGGELYVWTVDDLQQIRELEALGVHGVISNDPRLFAFLA